MVSAHNKRCARRWLMLGFGAGCCALRGFGALRQIHLAAKHGIVFDREPERANIAFNHAAGAQFDAAAGRITRAVFLRCWQCAFQVS